MRPESFVSAGKISDIACVSPIEDKAKDISDSIWTIKTRETTGRFGSKEFDMHKRSVHPVDPLWPGCLSDHSISDPDEGVSEKRFPDTFHWFSSSVRQQSLPNRVCRQLFFRNLCLLAFVSCFEIFAVFGSLKCSNSLDSLYLRFGITPLPSDIAATSGFLDTWLYN
jgi:hypothetical protein